MRHNITVSFTNSFHGNGFIVHITYTEININTFPKIFRKFSRQLINCRRY
ncbi:hypothetical protein ACE1ET_06635 [Saccharicrinis sp. FJH62]